MTTINFPFSTISNDTLATMRTENPDLIILDVRTTEEHQQLGYIPGATLISLQDLPYAYRMLDADEPIVVMCQHGVRSIDACYFLTSQGFKSLYNVDIGYSGWTGDITHVIE